MLNKEYKSSLIRLFKKLIKTLEKNDIWYILEGGTLLGAAREEEMIEWDDDIDIAINIDGYKKLKKLFPNNVLDNDDEGYPLLFPKWVDDKEGFDTIVDGKPSIDMFLIIPTNRKRYKKFSSMRNKIKYSLQSVNRSKFHKFSVLLKILMISQVVLFFWYRKKINIDDVIKILNEEDSNAIEDNVVIYHPVVKYDRYITPMNNFKTTNLNFEGIKCKAPEDYRRVLINRFGSDYMKPKKPKYVFEHINSISVRKKKIS